MIVTPLRTAAGPKTSMNFVEGRFYKVSDSVGKRLQDNGLVAPVERTSLPGNVIVEDLPNIANVPSNLGPDTLGPTFPNDVSQNELVQSLIDVKAELAELKKSLGKK